MSMFTAVKSALIAVTISVAGFLGLVDKPRAEIPPPIQQLEIQPLPIPIPAPEKIQPQTKTAEKIPSIKPKIAPPQNVEVFPPSKPIQPSWLDLENKYFLEAYQKGWSSLVITNTNGEKRFYLKEGNVWVRKNSEAEIEVNNQLPEYCKNPQNTSEAEYCLELAGQRLGFPANWYGGTSGGGSSNYLPPSYSPSTPSFSEQMRQRDMCDLVNGVFINGKCL